MTATSFGRSSRAFELASETAEGEVGEEEGLVDDEDVGHLQLLTRLVKESVVVSLALLSQAVARIALDRLPHRRRWLEREVAPGPVARPPGPTAKVAELPQFARLAGGAPAPLVQSSLLQPPEAGGSQAATLTRAARNGFGMTVWRNGRSFSMSCSWRLIVCVETMTRLSGRRGPPGSRARDTRSSCRRRCRPRRSRTSSRRSPRRRRGPSRAARDATRSCRAYSRSCRRDRGSGRGTCGHCTARLADSCSSSAASTPPSLSSGAKKKERRRSPHSKVPSHVPQ